MLSSCVWRLSSSPILTCEKAFIISTAAQGFLFLYGSLSPNSSGVTSQDKLYKLQNKATCVKQFSNYDADADQILEIWAWKNLYETLCCQRNIQKATMAFKCLLVYLSYLGTSKSRDSLNALQAEGL